MYSLGGSIDVATDFRLRNYKHSASDVLFTSPITRFLTETVRCNMYLIFLWPDLILGLMSIGNAVTSFSITTLNRQFGAPRSSQIHKNKNSNHVFYPRKYRLLPAR